MSDLVMGKMNPNVANAAINAGGKLLKVAEMQRRYGIASDDSPAKDLLLAPAAQGRAS